MKILVIDNKFDPPAGSPDICRFLSQGYVSVRRGPDNDLPHSLNEWTHLIISGSKNSCLDTKSLWVESLLGLIRQSIERGIPILGICFGHQMIVRAVGGISAVQKAEHPEFGWVKVKNLESGLTQDNPVLGYLPQEFHVFESHFEEVAKLPPAFKITAQNERSKIQAFRMMGKPVFGVQFHPERNVQEGEETLKNKKKTLPKHMIFNAGRSTELYSQKIPETIFQKFIEIRR